LLRSASLSGTSPSWSELARERLRLADYEAEEEQRIEFEPMAYGETWNAMQRPALFPYEITILEL
jgi:hypothetical protein